MTKVSSASSADGSTPWFKVAELGPSFSNGQISFPSMDRDAFTFTIPKSLPSGDYLLRAENIAIHAASNPGSEGDCRVRKPATRKAYWPGLFVSADGAGMWTEFRML